MLDWIWLFVSGFFIGLVAAAPIGPVNLICIRRTLQFGPINGFLTGMGAAVGDGVFAVIAAFGLTAASQLIEGNLFFIELFGGLILLGYAIKTLLSDVSLPEPIHLKSREQNVARAAGAGLLRPMAAAFALTITNPATMFGFAALFAGLGSFSQGASSYAQAVTVVAAVVAGSAAWWFFVTAFTSLFHHQIGERGMRIINKVTGFVIGAFGLSVLGNLVWSHLL